MRFMINDDYGLLPINIGEPSFATSNDCWQLMAINTIVFLTIGEDFSQQSNGFMNRCMLLCKCTTHSSVRCITFNWEWFGKVWQGNNKMAA